MPDTRCKMHDAGYRIQDFGCWILAIDIFADTLVQYLLINFESYNSMHATKFVDAILEF